jgi:tetratricopeptide (TPR) repeat protein
MLTFESLLGLYDQANRLVAAHQCDQAVPKLESLVKEMRPVLDSAASKAEKSADESVAHLHLAYCHSWHSLGICRFDQDQLDLALQAFDEGLRANALTVCELKPDEKTFGDLVLRVSDPRPKYQKNLGLNRAFMLYEKALVYLQQGDVGNAITNCKESLKVGLSHGRESLKALNLLCDLHALNGDPKSLGPVATYFQEALEARLELADLRNYLTNGKVQIRTRGAAGGSMMMLKGFRLHRLTGDIAAPGSRMSILQVQLKNSPNRDRQDFLNERTLGWF